MEAVLQDRMELMVFNNTYWDIIKTNFLEALCEFLATNDMPRSWTSTLIFLVPKVDSPIEFIQLRPISLCNFSSKVISKLLSNRLSPLLPKIIPPEQSGFVKGRLVQGNILLAQEFFHFINLNVRGSNLAIKLNEQTSRLPQLAWYN